MICLFVALMIRAIHFKELHWCGKYLMTIYDNEFVPGVALCQISRPGAYGTYSPPI